MWKYNTGVLTIFWVNCNKQRKDRCTTSYQYHQGEIKFDENKVEKSEHSAKINSVEIVWWNPFY